MLSYSNFKRVSAPIAGLAVLAATAMPLLAAATSEHMNTLFDGPFLRVPAERESGRSVAAHCQIDGATSSEHWADARANLLLRQDGAMTEVTVAVEDARPDTLFTIWLMLEGGSPLMKTGATALIHSDDIAEAVDLMAAPSHEATNGFVTDADGNGSVTLLLDYTIIGGAFPFQNYAEFDAGNPAFSRDTPRPEPTRIANARDGVPFTLRLASHCGDNLHNGLVAGQHEPWFDWLAQ